MAKRDNKTNKYTFAIVQHLPWVSKTNALANHNELYKNYAHLSQTPAVLHRKPFTMNI